MSSGYTSDPSRRRVVRTTVLVVGTVLGVAVGWLLFITISWMFGLGATREQRGDAVNHSAQTSVEQGDRNTGTPDDPYDPYGDIAPIGVPALPE